MCDPSFSSGSSLFSYLLRTVCTHGQCSSYILFFFYYRRISRVCIFLCLLANRYVCMHHFISRSKLLETFCCYVGLRGDHINLEIATSFNVAFHCLTLLFIIWPVLDLEIIVETSAWTVNTWTGHKATWLRNDSILMSFYSVSISRGSEYQRIKYINTVHHG